MWCDFKHDRRRGTIGSRIDDDNDDEAVDTDMEDGEEAELRGITGLLPPPRRRLRSWPSSIMNTKKQQ